MEIIHNQHIGTYKNSFSQEWCDKVISYYENNKSHSFNRKEYQPLPASLVKDQAMNLTDLWRDTPKKESYEAFKLMEVVKNTIEEITYPLYQEEYFSFPKKYKIQGYKVQKTLPSQGYHIWHCENDPYISKYSSRFMAYTIYLNNINEGGETEFLNQSIRVKPEAGTLCIFPSNYTHTHRGNPPLSGTKYIMTGWLTSINEEDYLSNSPLYQPTQNT